MNYIISKKDFEEKNIAAITTAVGFYDSRLEEILNRLFNEDVTPQYRKRYEAYLSNKNKLLKHYILCHPCHSEAFILSNLTGIPVLKIIRFLCVSPDKNKTLKNILQSLFDKEGGCKFLILNKLLRHNLYEICSQTYTGEIENYINVISEETIDILAGTHKRMQENIKNLLTDFQKKLKKTNNLKILYHLCLLNKQAPFLNRLERELLI